MQKKQKILIIVLIACVVLAAGGITAAVLLHKKSAAPTTAAQNASSSVQSTTQSGMVPGEQYVKKEYRKEYRTVSSADIKNEPDAKIKAYFYNVTKDASPELVLKNFDLLKVYEGFRFYDTAGTTDKEGTQHFLLLVYVENGKAVIAHYEEYQDSSERADLLTEYIKELDKDYERYAKYAKSLDGEAVLYE